MTTALRLQPELKLQRSYIKELADSALTKIWDLPLSGQKKTIEGFSFDLKYEYEVEVLFCKDDYGIPSYSLQDASIYDEDGELQPSMCIDLYESLERDFIAENLIIERP